MISRWKRQEHQPAGPLSNRAIILGVVIVLGVGTAAWTVLLWRYGGADPDVELDAIRTASAITAATGGAVALLLAARRQQSTERTLELQREVAQATERDAVEQRITELYARAVDQLGAEKAPVRLGGLHALERLAQNNSAQRQTIVDVICAYLRMPFTPPGDQAPGEDAPQDAHSRYEQRRQELQVRLTAQRILTAHLQPEAAADFWADIDLNLTEAHLPQFNLATCHVRKAQFRGATFAGDAVFNGAEFAGDTTFVEATFAGAARFNEATFTGNAGFGGATFTGSAVFERADFAGRAWFHKVKFTGGAGFRGAEFAGDALFRWTEFAESWFHDANFSEGADFYGAKFAGSAVFHGAKFAGTAKFRDAKFDGTAGFRGVMFAEDAGFDRVTFFRHAEFAGAMFAGAVRFNEAMFAGAAGFGAAKFTALTKFDGARVALSSRLVLLPTGWTTRAAQPGEGEEEDWLYVVRGQDSSEQPTEATDDGEG